MVVFRAVPLPRTKEGERCGSERENEAPGLGGDSAAPKPGEEEECMHPGVFQGRLFNTSASRAGAASLCKAAFGWQVWPLLGMRSDG